MHLLSIKLVRYGFAYTRIIYKASVMLINFLIDNLRKKELNILSYLGSSGFIWSIYIQLS